MDGLWIFLIVCVSCGFLTKMASLKLRFRERHGYGEEDTRMSQEVHRDLKRMQERLEALETILIDRERTERSARVAEEIGRL